MLNFFISIPTKMHLFFVSLKTKNTHIILNDFQDFLLKINIRLVILKKSYIIINYTNGLTFFKFMFASALLNLPIMLISFSIKIVFFLLKPSRYLAENHLTIYWHYVCFKKTTKRLFMGFFFKAKAFYCKINKTYERLSEIGERLSTAYVNSPFVFTVPMFSIYIIFINAYFNVTLRLIHFICIFKVDIVNYEPNTEFAYHYVHGLYVTFWPLYKFMYALLMLFISVIEHLMLYKSLFIYIFFSFVLLKFLSRIPLFYFLVKLPVMCGSLFIIYFYCYEAILIYYNYILYYVFIIGNKGGFIFIYYQLVDYIFRLYGTISTCVNNFSIMQNFFGLHMFFIVCSAYILYTITASVSNLSIFLKTFMFFLFTVIYMFYLNLDTWACFLIIVESSALFLLAVLLNRVKLYNFYFFSKKNTVVLLCILVYASLLVSYSDYSSLSYFYINFFTKVIKGNNSDFIGIVPLIFSNTSLFFFIIIIVSIVTIFIVLKFNVNFNKKHFFLKKSKHTFFFKKIKNYLYSNIDLFFLKVSPSVNRWFKK